MFRDAAAVAGAEMDRSRVGRCITLRTVFPAKRPFSIFH